MPSGERINPGTEPEENVIDQTSPSEVDLDTGEQTPRSTYETRGEKANQSVINEAKAERPSISELSLEDLLAIDVNEYSRQELLEARARLKEERRALVGSEKGDRREAKNSNRRETTDELRAKLEARERQRLEAQERQNLETREEAQPEAESAQPAAPEALVTIPEPELKDTSGLDVPTSDPEFTNSINDPDREVDPAALTVPIVPPIDADRTMRMETISPDEADRTYEEFSQKPGLKEFFSKTANRVIAGVLAFVILTSGIIGVAAAANNANQQDQAGQTPTEQVAEADDEADEDDDVFSQISDKKTDQAGQSTQPTQSTQSTQANRADQAKDQSAERQDIRNGYSEKGMYTSANKSGAYDFASAAEVSEACNGNKIEMVKYTASNQIESLADYVAHLPADLQPDGFKGLSILDTEHKLESLSDAEYQAVLNQFNQAMSKSVAQDVVLDGDYHNAYMYKDASAPATHDNIQLVECTTNETGKHATKYVFYDANGKELGSMIVKTNECMQAVDHIDSGTAVYVGMESVPDNPAPDPGTGSESTGSEGTGSEGTGSEGTGSEDTGSEGTGSEDTGSEGTGSEDTGSEGTGSEETGSEGTGNEDTGSEDTGEEDTGSEDTGEEDTGSEDTGEEDTGTEDTGEEDTGDEGTGDENTGDEGTDIEQKDYENMERIDNQILDDIADDIGTDQVNVTPTDEVSQDDLTEQPSGDDYQGTEADIVQNEPSQEDEPVQDQISEVNDYGQGQGGANADEYAPVQADDQDQAAANEAEISQDQAPDTIDEVGSDILSDLGTN